MGDSIANSCSSSCVGLSANKVPHIGMEFDSLDKAWNFWVEYGGQRGFNVRKHYANRNKFGQVSSKRFVCAKEGFRPTDKRDKTVTNHRAETRTGCNVRMGVCWDKKKGTYVVQDFISDHNHELHPPETVHLLAAQRKITEVQAMDIELADEVGIKPRAAHELNCATVGGKANLSYTHTDHKNYLRSKRQREMVYGEAGTLLKYFHSKTLENPSFQYSIQLDSEEQITNIFWADAKMLIDYQLFGDVVGFDTTFGTNKDNRPLGVFVGLNHFRELVVFGAVLLYDETFESFKWLFETFLATHDDKRPKTIFTDQDIAMGKVVADVMPDTWHGLCTWHIMQNATKRLLHSGSNNLKTFSACMYDYEDEATFEEAFTTLRKNVENNPWLDSIYALKRKWAGCYMTDVFSLGMRSTQLCESFNKDLKGYLHCNLDILRFFKHFERIVQQKRDNEISSAFDSREKLPKLKLRRTPVLRQVGQLYTLKVFETFQDEYEWSTAAYIKPIIEGQLDNEYRVGITDPEDDKTDDCEYRVFGDPSTQSVACSCKMFERLGILCRHALKVLDTMNIKLIPEKYILKRWTRDARSGIVQHSSGNTILGDPHLEATRRYRALCRKFVQVASRAANFVESSALLEGMVDNVTVEVDKILSSMNFESIEQVSSIPCHKLSTLQKPTESCNLSTVTLKRRVQKQGGRRKMSWTEKFHKNNARKLNFPKLDSNAGKEKNEQRKRKKDQQNKENEVPEEGDNQQPLARQRTSNQNNDQVMNSTQAMSNFSEETYFPSQDMTLHFRQQIVSQSVLNDISNDEWLGI